MRTAHRPRWNPGSPDHWPTYQDDMPDQAKPQEMVTILTDRNRATAHPIALSRFFTWPLLGAFLLLASACTTLPGSQSEGGYPLVVESGVSAGLASAGLEIPPLDEVLSEANALHEQGEPLPPELAATLIDAAVNERRWDVADAVVRSTSPERMNVDEFARFSLATINYFNLLISMKIYGV